MNRYIKNNQIFEMYVHAKSKMKRETGANPVRSRHCKRESVIIMSLQKLWEDDDRCRTQVRRPAYVCELITSYGV